MAPGVFGGRAAWALALVAVVAGGCAAVLGFEETTLRSLLDEGGTQPDAGAAEGGAEGGAARLTVTPASLLLRRGGSLELTVGLDRGDLAGDVLVRVSNLPGGVTATAASIPGGATSATLRLTAAAGATLGATSLRLTAEGTGLPPAEAPLLVADAAGALDVTFDGDGAVVEAASGVAGTFYGLGVLADQRIVAVGAGISSPGWLVRRFGAAGVADTAFDALAGGGAGVPTSGEARAFAVDPAGNLVVVGSSLESPSPQQQLTIARFKPSGALDATFGSAGLVRPLVAESPSGSVGLAVALQPDGAIVVVGSRRDSLNKESGVIARFKANGARDATFNGGVSVATVDARYIGVSIEPSGAILVSGSTVKAPLPSYVLTRLTALGTVDPSFASAGSALFGNTYRANASARLPDGSVALVGDVQQGAQGYTAGVATALGDAVFARGYGNAVGAGFFGVAVQNDGRIVAAGHRLPNGEARVGRLLVDGTPDPSFSDAGTAIVEPAGSPSSDVSLFAAAVQADGRILVAGNRSNAGAIVFRLWP